VILNLPIREVLPATPRAHIVRLDLDGHPFEYAAGQAVLVGNQGSETRKPYSIACAPEDARRDGWIELLVGMDEDPQGGPAFTLRRGATVDVEGPLGTFTFPAAPVERRFVFIAGGTGIAPMRVLAEQESGRRNVTLLMGGRSVAHLWPSDRLPATVEYVTTTEDGSFGVKGRVTDAIQPLLEWADQACACGPWPMLAALGRLRDNAERAAGTYPGRAALLETQIAVEQHMGCAMGVCRACVIVTAQGNARVCREGPVFALGDVAFAEGEPATVGVTG